MFRKISPLVMFAVALIASGCATTTPYNPFKVTREEIYDKTRTIVLAPVAMPSGLDDPEPAKNTFQRLIEAKLQEARFMVVPSEKYAEIWKEMTEQVGGYFDPVSGKRDESKYKTVREHTFQELKTKFNADATLYPVIWVAKVNWSGTMARWHGASEPIMSTGRQIVEALAGISRQGTLPALSLSVYLRDIHGTDLYINSGGIQLLSKFSGGKLTTVPQQELFVNPERNQGAVDIALDPLTKKAGSP